MKKWDFAVAEIVPGPGNLDEPAWKKEIIRPGVKATEDLIVAYDENNYRPHGYCQDIVNATGDNFKDGVFRVESLVGQLKKEVEKKWPFCGRHHSHIPIQYLVLDGSLYYGLYCNLWK